MQDGMHRNGRSMRKIPIAPHEPAGRAWRRSASSKTGVSNMFRNRCRCGVPRSRQRNVCEFDDPIKPHRNIRMSSKRIIRTMRIHSHAYPVFRIATMLAQEIQSPGRSSKKRMKTAAFPLHRESRIAPILIISADSADRGSDGNRFVSIYSTSATSRTGLGSR